jgi:hypothetical protein
MAWAASRNSLFALSVLVDRAELSDQGVILEYQLGNQPPGAEVIQREAPISQAALTLTSSGKAAETVSHSHSPSGHS